MYPGLLGCHLAYSVHSSVLVARAKCVCGARGHSKMSIYYVSDWPSGVLVVSTLTTMEMTWSSVTMEPFSR